MRITYLLLLLLLFLVSCNSGFNSTEEEKVIRNMLKQERDAHFSNNVNMFLAEFADSMISVNKGIVRESSLDDNKKRIEPYFNSVKFIKWDDIESPIIKFSNDGSLAYAVVQKEVVLSYPDSAGKLIIDSTYFAWVSIYRKNESGWKVEANISTNK